MSTCRPTSRAEEEEEAPPPPASAFLNQAHAISEPSPASSPPTSSPHELLDYVAFLENELEHMKLQSVSLQEKHHSEKTRLKERLDAALDKIDDTEHELHAHKTSSAQSSASVERLKDEFQRSKRLLHEQRRKEKNLDDRVQKLELELEMKNDLINHRRKRDERARKQLEKDNEILKKKATLGWMLGCLSEVYLQSEPEAAAAPLLKLVRNIQRELERENVVLSYSNGPPQLHLDYVQREIRRLIECARAASDSGTNQASLIKKNEGDHTESLCENLTECFGDEIPEANASNAVACRPQDSHTSRKPEEGGSPTARYIINCFAGGDTIRNNENFRIPDADEDEDEEEDELSTSREQPNCHTANNCSSSQAQIEMFEANPEADVEHTRLGGSTWAELKVMNKQGAEAAEMRHCQADIKRMLSRLEASMQYLLKNQPAEAQKQEAVPEARDRSIDDIILSAAHHGRKTKSASEKSTEKSATARKHKLPAATMKHRAGAASSKQKPTGAEAPCARVKSRK